ncbi:MAG TPA: GNAT family N-acetyltransferase [Pyrinomonadaceae bacterium]|jgi:hypothetical protein
MYTTSALVNMKNLNAAQVATWAPFANSAWIQVLRSSEDAAEAQSFLAARPIHTVTLRSFIRDNGLESPLNRGKFYGYRNAEGELEGVALIGHATLIEARTTRSLEAFARKAQQGTRAHMIMGEQERIEGFWNCYSDEGQKMRRACRELLFELHWPVEARNDVTGLRQATLADLDLVKPVQAQMAFEESGVNPMESDPIGFTMRCARRIEQGRTWVLVENGKLIFKAEVMSETPEVSYLEGIHVDEQERGQGLGLRCLSQLTRTLLRRTRSLCILVNEQNTAAHSFYRQAGFKFQCYYDTIYLQQR